MEIGCIDPKHFLQYISSQFEVFKDQIATKETKLLQVDADDVFAELSLDSLRQQPLQWRERDKILQQALHSNLI
jgi:hypothetical protein